MSGQQLSFRPPAQTWQEVDTHVRYLQDGQARLEGKLDALLGLVPKMATTDYIDAKFKALADEYAPKVQVTALQAEVADIRKELESRTVQSTLDRWGSIARNAAAIVACVTASAYFVVGALDAVKAHQEVRAAK